MDHHALVCNFIFILLIRSGSLQLLDDENICLKHPDSLVIANPEDCNSFYACQLGNAIKVICPNKSIFNPTIGNCDPDYTDCVNDESETNDKNEILSEDINENALTSETEETEPTTSSSLNSTNSDVSVTDENTNEISTSSSNVALETTTSNPSTNTPEDFSSQSSNLPTNTTPSLTTTSTEEIDCDTTHKPDPPIASNLCPSKDSDEPTFFANHLFCDSFYLCYHGRPYEMFCPAGFNWSQEHKKCILERESNCVDSTGYKVPKCPSNGQFFIPHSERCNLFYYCENGIRSIQQCTAFEQWDVVERTCKLDISAKCIKTIPRSQRAQYFVL